MSVLNSGNLTMGSQVKKFERLMAEYLGFDHFVMMNSGSSANLAMVEALLRPVKDSPKLQKGDKVLVPAVAWPTTIWPLVQLGLEPIFVDVDPESISIDLNKAQEAIDEIGASVRAIFPIHPLGYAIPPSSLDTFISMNNLVLINDVCESLGSWAEGKHAGASGQAASFSFYFSHHITTMEGGGVATNDFEFSEDLRAIRSHGWSRDRADSADWHKGAKNIDSKFLFVTSGFNIRPMEVQAAIGISQLEDLESFILKRKNIANSVYTKIKETSLNLIGFDLFIADSQARNHSWMLLPLRVTGGNAQHRKRQITTHLETLGIETRPILTGNFLAQPAMTNIFSTYQSPDQFPVANLLTETGFMVGAHHDLSDMQIDFLCNSLFDAVENLN
jgi:CDP-6-deoxy-D-xylo-4-hexulose-3-dehydrase